ncbi:MAG: hypothetical protein KAZ88_10880 [Acidimicrobiia bacterium]|jgi:hypothetical protein|nr:hypothetical protein [Acidimicrobiia bacterium]MBP8181484.1 hypothetical protein [Acidimicrobiia bacterium]
MEIGTRVEVRNNFDHEWARGFEVIEVDTVSEEPAYRVKRTADGRALPVWFTEDSIREERRGRGMWWV